MLCNTGHRELSDRLSGVKPDFFFLPSLLPLLAFGFLVFHMEMGVRFALATVFSGKHVEARGTLILLC